MSQVVGARTINEYGIKIAIAKIYGCNVGKVELGVHNGELCAEIPSGERLMFADEDDGK